MGKNLLLNWYTSAENDLFFANKQFKCGASSYQRVCFDCYSAAKKLHKAFLISNNVIDFPYPADLVQLNSFCLNFNYLFSSIKSECERLNIYGVIATYPSKLIFTEDLVRQALADADTIFKFPPIAISYSNAKAGHETDHAHV